MKPEFKILLMKPGLGKPDSIIRKGTYQSSHILRGVFRNFSRGGGGLIFFFSGDGGLKTP